ncbi:hypothetical protein [Pikeienuella sp. HZG-20]|uniref:hypothetical protein n=1 Tax=Paludibacillus litoralis TaxID=3133267 RepID=UPI0030EDACFF
MAGEPDLPPAPEPKGATIRILLRIAVLLLAAYGVHLLIGWAAHLSISGNPHARTGVLIALVLTYALLIAIPFVPGVELGLLLMAMEGAPISPLIYAATIMGLGAAYAAGAWLPYSRLHGMLADMRMRRACALLDRIAPLTSEERVQMLRSRAPAWARPFVSRYRYLLLAALVNLPGNSLIGGGGGILFMAGLSRLFRPAATLLTIGLAVAPVPLIAWLFDIKIMN